jgi:hypothetical protein
MAELRQEIYGECYQYLVSLGESQPTNNQTPTDQKNEGLVPIDEIRLIYDNDEQILIQVPGNLPKPYPAHLLGFNRTSGKTWKDFLNILKNPPHTYDQGQANSRVGGKKIRNSAYDNRRKRRGEINRKLCAALKQHLNVDIPDGYNLFELSHEGAGTYGLNCKVGDDEPEQVIDLAIPDKKLKEMGSSELIEYTKALAETYIKEKENGTPTDETKLSFEKVAKIAVKRGLMTKAEISDLLIHRDVWENIESDKLVDGELNIT